METSFLIQSWKKLKSLLLPNGKEDLIDSSDNLARFLTSSGWFASTKGRVKYKAYMPAPNGELSVFSIGLKKESNVRDIAVKYVHPKMSHVSIYGYGSFVVREFEQILNEFEKSQLKLVKDNEPPGHVNITNWPVSKDEQMFLAQEIAEISRLKIFSKKIEREK